MQNFRELEVWKDARILTKKVYILTKQMPDTERFGLISQMNRAVISITANITEGAAKDSQKNFSRFLQISLDSAFELESHLILSNDLNLTNGAKIDSIITKTQELQKRIAAFINYLKTIS